MRREASPNKTHTLSETLDSDASEFMTGAQRLVRGHQPSGLESIAEQASTAMPSNQKLYEQ